MPGVYYAPFSAATQTDAEPAGGNTGRWPLGHYLITPDNRKYRYTLNDATAELAGNLYQSATVVANHINTTVDAARAIGAVVVSTSLAATSMAEDIYNEGLYVVNDVDGEAYAYRIKRARSNAQGHASAAASAIGTFNLEADSSVQVALTTSSNVSLVRNRFREVLRTPTPAPTARLAGVSPGVAAADRYYWSQVSGEAAVLADGTILVAKRVQASLTAVGAVESYKRRIETGGTTVATTNPYPLMNQDAASVGVGIINTASVSAYDITGGTSINSLLVGVAVTAPASTDYALIDLLYLGA